MHDSTKQTSKTQSSGESRRTSSSAEKDRRLPSGFAQLGYAEQSAALSPLQLDNGGGHLAPPANPHAVAAKGMSGSGGPLPYADKIQQSFGSFDVSGIRAHTDAVAAEATGALGAQGYAHNGAVALAPGADLHTVAHEAAHVFQQRRGVQLKGGVGTEGDVHERQADEVADAVVAGRNAEELLRTNSIGTSSENQLQLRKKKPGREGKGAEPLQTETQSAAPQDNTRQTVKTTLHASMNTYAQQVLGIQERAVRQWVQKMGQEDKATVGEALLEALASSAISMASGAVAKLLAAGFKSVLDGKGLDKDNEAAAAKAARAGADLFGSFIANTITDTIKVSVKEVDGADKHSLEIFGLLQEQILSSKIFRTFGTRLNQLTADVMQYENPVQMAEIIQDGITQGYSAREAGIRQRQLSATMDAWIRARGSASNDSSDQYTGRVSSVIYVEVGDYTPIKASLSQVHLGKLSKNSKQFMKNRRLGDINAPQSLRIVPVVDGRRMAKDDGLVLERTGTGKRPKAAEYNIDSQALNMMLALAARNEASYRAWLGNFGRPSTGNPAYAPLAAGIRKLAAKALQLKVSSGSITLD